MKRKHIDIQGNNINSGPWLHTVPANKFTFITANRVSFAITENTYYLDTKKDKIRYTFNNCNNASYSHMYVIYMEAYPGIFAECMLCTEDNLTATLEKYSKIYHEHNYPNNPDIEVWRKNLIRK